MYGMSDIRGDRVWDTVCYLGCTGETFRTKDVEQHLVRHGFKPKTAQLYFNRFVHYALANPDEFSGPRSKLIRVHPGLYRLDDNPER